MTQTRATRQRAGRQRQSLNRLQEELAEVLEVLYERAPVVRGTVYELARKCGNPGCRCTRGELHRSMVLSWSEGGRSRLKVLKASQVEELRARTDAYRRLRQARVRLVKIGRQMVEIIDEIETLRRQEPDDG